MRNLVLGSLLSVTLLAGCGSSGGAPAAVVAQLSAQEIVEQCLTTDLLEFAGILDLLQGLLDGNTAGLTPQIDLLQGILGGGIFPWGVDLDGDTVNDLTGTIHLRDPAGNVTIPLGLIGVIDPDDLDLEAILAALPPARRSISPSPSTPSRSRAPTRGAVRARSSSRWARAPSPGPPAAARSIPAPAT
ncbi:MAG: hypothetical protein HC813_00925 [Planctomycetes bacterium]|nr:hypothetical protein [Planctomycetota bacterium]